MRKKKNVRDVLKKNAVEDRGKKKNVAVELHHHITAALAVVQEVVSAVAEIVVSEAVVVDTELEENFKPILLLRKKETLK